MDTFRQDIRYAIRRLVKSPGFTLVAVVTLALGIGANSAIFSVVNGVLLRPLPYHEPDGLVGLYHVPESGQRAVMSGPNFTDVRKLSQTLADAAALTRTRTILTGEGEPVRLDGAAVSAGLFGVLGVRPVLGRTFNADENEPGRTNVTVISHGLWRTRFGASPDVVGRRITLDGVPTEVIGVMPEGFSFPAGRALWTPLEYSPAFLSGQRSAWYLTAIGRVKPGIPLERVTAEVETIGQQLARQYPDHNEGLGFTAMSLHEATVGNIRKAVLVLLGAVGFVLLIACANVANLLLARAAAREAEMAVRSALGAGRGRLIRQLLTESVILSLVGAGLGLLLAVWGVDMLKGLRPDGIPRLDDVQVDGIVMAFTAALAVLTGLVFGLVPAFQSTTTAIAGTLKEGGRGALSTRMGAKMRSALVVVEMALAVMLLAGAGLLIRSFTALAAVDPGFRGGQALTFELSLPASRYEEDARQIAFVDQLLSQLRAVPGVQAAAAVSSLPLSGASFVITFEVEGRPPVPSSQQPAMQVRVATAGYFEAIGIPLRRGRLFGANDRPGSTPVVLLTETAARRYFPGEDPLGKKIRLGWGRGEGRRAGGEVVGIIGDVKDAGLDEPDPPQIYLPYTQWPLQGLAILMKTGVRPASVSDGARAAVYAVDPNLPLANIRTLEEVVARSISQPRFYTTLLTVFASLALMLAAIGIFGVLSYAVAQRTREIGIRMALGAQGGTVLRLVVKDAMLLAAAGVAIGSACAFILSRSLVASLLFDTSPRDPLTFATVATLLGAVALLASYVPARRATRVDPVVALRAE